MQVTIYSSPAPLYRYGLKVLRKYPFLIWNRLKLVCECPDTFNSHIRPDHVSFEHVSVGLFKDLNLPSTICERTSQNN